MVTTCFKPNVGPFSSEVPSRRGTHLTTHFLERQERFLELSWSRALCPFIFPKLQMHDINMQVKVNILQVTETSSFQRNERNNRMSEWALTHRLCPTLCDSIDYSLLGPSVHAIFQAIILEWVATSFSKVTGSWETIKATKGQRTRKLPYTAIQCKCMAIHCRLSWETSGGFPKFLPV